MVVQVHRQYMQGSIYGQVATHVREVNYFRMSDHEIMVNKGRIVCVECGYLFLLKL